MGWTSSSAAGPSYSYAVASHSTSGNTSTGNSRFTTSRCTDTTSSTSIITSTTSMVTSTVSTSMATSGLVALATSAWLHYRVVLLTTSGAGVKNNNMIHEPMLVVIKLPYLKSTMLCSKLSKGMGHNYYGEPA